jgi:TonB family protein
MLVRVTRTASALTLRALFYGGLFALVVIVHLALTSVLRGLGWSATAALTASGALVLGLVLAAVNVADWVRERLEERREMQRLKQRLPAGPCCVIWRADAAGGGEEAMPWEPVGPVRARYPKLARRLGVEGVAVAEFEVNAEGRAKNIACVDAWPSDVFYEAAREALLHARFQPKYDEHVRFGASYRIPFVFRIAGAARLEERGRRARKLRPALHAAQEALQKLRDSSA